MSSSPLKKLNEDLIASTPYESYKKRVGLLNSNSTKLSTQGSKHGSALYYDNLAPNHDRLYGALSNKNTYSPGSAFRLRKNKINLNSSASTKLPHTTPKSLTEMLKTMPSGHETTSNEDRLLCRSRYSLIKLMILKRYKRR